MAEEKKKKQTKISEKKSAKKPTKKVEKKKKKASKKSQKKVSKKIKYPKIEKPKAPKKIKEMTPKEKRDFDNEVKEYKEKIKARKIEIKTDKKKLRDKRSEKFNKTKFGKLVNKIKPKKKPPKLEDKKLSKEEARRRGLVKRVGRKTKAMRRRCIGVVAMCVAVCLVILGGFKVAGALELNAGQAARTGDTYFMEADVTKYITEQTLYKQYSKSVSSWTQYLSMYGLTGEKFRQQVIEDHFAHNELVLLAAEEEGITVEDSVVDAHVESFKAKYKDDASYKKALEDAGYTEETYRENVYVTSLEKALTEKVITSDAPSDDDVKSYLTSYSSAYKDARKSSHILFDSKDTDIAQSVLDQIKAGTLTFEVAVAKYSIDNDTKAKGGDRGWDKIENFSSAYNSGLSGLAAGEVNSTLVTDKDGIHIIKCTEKWDTPEKIESLDGVPSAIIEECRHKKDESNKKTKLEDWLKTWADEHGVETKIFPMPPGLPYDADMSNTNKNASSSAAGGTTTTTTS